MMRLHVRIHITPTDWCVWPIYAPREHPGRVWVGPLLIEWHREWHPA